MTIGEKIIAAIDKADMVRDATSYLDAVPEHKNWWATNSAEQLEAVVAAHVEEQVRLRMDSMICVTKKDGSYVLLPIKTGADGKKFVDMDDEIRLKCM